MTKGKSTIEDTQLLDSFSNHLYARSGMKESSILLVVGYIRRMLPETGARPTDSQLNDYIAGLRKRDISHGHLVNAFRSIEHFTTFLGSPTKFQRPRKPRNAHTSVLSEAKITLIIAATKNLRERAMIMLLAYSGCRNNELINIRNQDVDPSQQSVLINTAKGGRGRITPLAGECIEVLVDYLRERKGDPGDYLFVTKRHGHKMQTQDIRKIIHFIAKRAGIPTRVWPHLFRHSLATAMMERGANAYSIQAILGHAYVSTTMDYYLHPSTRNVKADYQRYVPSFV